MPTQGSRRASATTWTYWIRGARARIRKSSTILIRTLKVIYRNAFPAHFLSYLLCIRSLCVTHVLACHFAHLLCNLRPLLALCVVYLANHIFILLGFPELRLPACCPIVTAALHFVFKRICFFELQLTASPGFREDSTSVTPIYSLYMGVFLYLCRLALTIIFKWKPRRRTPF